MEYARVLELALYNAVLVGIALDGKSFFYENPLASIDGYLTRSKWFEVACCPANVRSIPDLTHMSEEAITLLLGCSASELRWEIHL